MTREFELTADGQLISTSALFQFKPFSFYQNDRNADMIKRQINTVTTDSFGNTFHCNPKGMEIFKHKEFFTSVRFNIAEGEHFYCLSIQESQNYIISIYEPRELRSLYFSFLKLKPFSENINVRVEFHFIAGLSAAR